MRSLSPRAAAISPSAAAMPASRSGTSKPASSYVRCPGIPAAFARLRFRPTAAVSPRAAKTRQSAFGRRNDQSGIARNGMAMTLPDIPIVDLRDGGPPLHAERSVSQARALRDACLGFFPRAALPLVPVLDGLSRRWLARSRSPYVPEIERIAASLQFSRGGLVQGALPWG